MSPSVVIAEKHEITQWSVASIVEDHGGRVVATPQSGLRTLTAVENEKPRVLIMALDLPRMHGFEVLRHLHNRTLATEVMVLTAHDDPDSARTALKRDVTSYLFKSDPVDAVGPAFEATAAGERTLSPALPDDLLETTVDNPAPRPCRTLTERQQEVLKLTAEGYTGEEMGKKLGVSRRTVEEHRRVIRERFGLKNLAELTRYAVEMGFYETSSSDWLNARIDLNYAGDSAPAKETG